MIRQEAPLDPIRAIDITTQILRAARFAHRRGVIHRDLKPHNVIIDETDHAKVTDFGIARAGASDMTETGSIMGTAQYLSPEQAQGHAVSAALGPLLDRGRALRDADRTGALRRRFGGDDRAQARVGGADRPERDQPADPARARAGRDVVDEQEPGRPSADADQFIAALEAAKTAIMSGAPGQRTTSFAALAAVGGAGAGFVVGAAGAPPDAPPTATRSLGTTAPAPTPVRCHPSRRRGGSADGGHG